MDQTQQQSSNVNGQPQVTLDSLAEMIKKGFDGVDERFNGVDKRLDEVEYRLGDVETRLDDIEQKLDNAAYRFELQELKGRVEVLEQNAGIVSRTGYKQQEE